VLRATESGLKTTGVCSFSQDLLLKYGSDTILLVTTRISWAAGLISLDFSTSSKEK